MEVPIICGTIIAIVGLICRTIAYCVKLDYDEKDKQRLREFDLSLQHSGKGDDLQLSYRLAQIVNSNCTTRMVGTEVIDELVQRGMITEQRANYVKS